jgi:hypothetical protein
MTEALQRYRDDRRAQMYAAVTRALKDLEGAGSVINVSSVAAAAGVSRQWLYDSPFRTEVEAIRTRTAMARPADARPLREAASDASLRAQNDALRQRLHEARAENAALRQELERALGLLRERA